MHVIGPGARPEPARLPASSAATATPARTAAWARSRSASARASWRTCWRRRRWCSGGRRRMRVTLRGRAWPRACTPKDLILRLIGEIGAAGGTGYAVEYAGSAIRALDVEGRLTICNLSIELGAKMGMIAPDDTTYAYIDGPPVRAQGRDVGARASRDWRTLPSDAGAEFDREVTIDVGRHRAADHLGHQPRACDRRRRAHSRSRRRSPIRAGAAACRRRSTTWGSRPATPIAGTQGRLGVHRLVHQQPHLRPARRGRGRARPQGGARRARLGGAGLGDGEARGGGRRARPRLPRRRLRMARARLLDVPRRQRRDRAARASARCRPPTATSSAARGRGARTHLASPAMAAAAAIAGAIADVRRHGRLSHGQVHDASPAVAAPILRENIDTDVDHSASRAWSATRRAASSGPGAFEPLRYKPDGSENPEFVLNREPYRGAQILLTGVNFGCGSSREAAVWALQEMGIRCVIALELRRHLLQQLLPERPAAGACSTARRSRASPPRWRRARARAASPSTSPR